MDMQLKKGLLDVLVLSTLLKEDSYGYRIIRDLGTRFGNFRIDAVPHSQAIGSGEAAERPHGRTQRQTEKILQHHQSRQNADRRISERVAGRNEGVSLHRKRKEKFRKRAARHPLNPDICGVCGNLKQGNGKENEIIKMNKQEYLNELKHRLKNLPEPEIEKSLAFYAEIIDDRIEEGADEESAVAGLASPEAAAKEILADMPLGSIVRGGAKQVKKRMGGKPLLVVLAVVGSPIWLTFLLAAAIVLFSVAIVLAALWASLFICAAGGVRSGPFVSRPGGRRIFRRQSAPRRLFGRRGPGARIRRHSALETTRRIGQAAAESCPPLDTQNQAPVRQQAGRLNARHIFRKGELDHENL